MTSVLSPEGVQWKPPRKGGRSGPALQAAPRRRGRAAENAGPGVPSFPGVEATPNIRLLLVEDDADNRELLAELLSLDFDVRTAADGQEAYERFLSEPVDVVITDETLPRMRGTQLARAVKERAPHVGVVLVSGYGRVPGAEACDAVLGKPVDVDVLTRTVRGLARPAGADTHVAP